MSAFKKTTDLVNTFSHVILPQICDCLASFSDLCLVQNPLLHIFIEFFLSENLPEFANKYLFVSLFY